MKSFKEISDLITEEEYRNDGRFHYSTLATYARGGFDCLETLFDRKESPSLTFGSAVDSLLTGGQEEFDKLFMVADYPEMPDTITKIVNDCFNEFHITHNSLSAIPDVEIIGRAANYNYQNNWKPETRAKVIKEKGEEYYRLKYIALDKTIISNDLYNDVLATVRELRESEATKWYFAADNPFDNSIERLYQLKFHYKSAINDLEYSCMADLIVVDHKNKIVYPCDLKTSSHKEYDFYKSFIDWSYHIQARLYWRIIRDTMDKDDYFKDFTLANYRFIVANKVYLTPLVWEYDDTSIFGNLTYGKNSQIICRDPFELASELNDYLTSRPKVPTGIKVTETNNIIEWLNKI